jgi:hypothetical protein
MSGICFALIPLATGVHLQQHLTKISATAIRAPIVPCCAASSCHRVQSKRVRPWLYSLKPKYPHIASAVESVQGSNPEALPNGKAARLPNAMQ